MREIDINDERHGSLQHRIARRVLYSVDLEADELFGIYESAAESVVIEFKANGGRTLHEITIR